MTAAAASQLIALAPPDLVGWFAIAIGAWLLFALFANRLIRGPRRTPDAGLMWYLIRLYARLVHRLRVDGRAHIPGHSHPGPLIVVCNHTAGVDPLLVQAACPFEIRWMMAADMQTPLLRPLLAWADVLSVDRNGGDSASARQAIRHLRDGGVLGVFPEGGIERPARRLLPFLGGIGLIVRRTGAPVLPVLIRDTPFAPTAWGSLYRRSRSRVTFLEPVDYSVGALNAQEIVDDLRRRFLEASGWAENPEPDIERIRA